MFHDSVSCWENYGNLPFPSRREPGTWVGMPMLLNTNKVTVQNSSFVFNETKGIKRFIPQINKIKSKSDLQPVLSRVPGSITKAHKKVRTNYNVPLSEDELNKKHDIQICPLKCRPFKHKDWIFC